jgi:hypothetical protein
MPERSSIPQSDNPSILNSAPVGSADSGLSSIMQGGSQAEFDEQVRGERAFLKGSLESLRSGGLHERPRFGHPEDANPNAAFERRKYW